MTQLFVCYNIHPPLLPVMSLKGRGKTIVIVRLALPEGNDGIRVLKQALKLLLRRFGLRAISVTKVAD